jgi:hypothetical protein
MEAQTYIDQLKNYAMEFQEWWIKPYEKFHSDFDKQNQKILLGFLPVKINSKESIAKFNEAAEQFEKEVVQKRDLFKEIFSFFDINYEAYRKATDLQRREIRSIIIDTSYVLRYEEKPLNHYVGNYMQMLIEKYRWHAFKEFKSTSHEICLTRALVAVSMEDCCCDFRELLTYLSRLYVTAERKNIEPKTIFDSIAEISSHEIPKGGSATSVSEMLMKIDTYEITKQERSFQEKHS